MDTAQQRYTLGKAERMKGRKAIDQIFDKGRAFSLFPLRVIYVLAARVDKIEKINKKEEGKGRIDKIDTVDKLLGLRCGFTTSAKRFKKATERNRIKRLIRESWRLQKGSLDVAVAEQNLQLDVFFIYIGEQLPEYEDVFAKTGKAIGRLIKIVNANSKAAT